MQRLRSKNLTILPFLLSTNKSSSSSSYISNIPLPTMPYRDSTSKGCGSRLSFGSLCIRTMSDTANYESSAAKNMVPEDEVRKVEVLNAVEDLHGGVTVEMEEPMEPEEFSSLLKASMSQWKEKGKRGVWLKLPIGLAKLVGAAVEQGFTYHHAEPDYLMLVYWIPETVNTLPANASHRVGIGAFVMNEKREVLVVQENSGRFKGTGVWKLPTGVVNEGEDILTAAVREVKEETGIDTKFVEVLAFRQSHKSFFLKSDLFFVCMLQPCSFDIEKQNIEIEAAQWMPVEDYASQPFVKKNAIFSSVAEICLAKTDGDYSGFSPRCSTTTSAKASYLYFNQRGL